MRAPSSRHRTVLGHVAERHRLATEKFISGFLRQPNLQPARMAIRDSGPSQQPGPDHGTDEAQHAHRREMKREDVLRLVDADELHRECR